MIEAITISLGEKSWEVRPLTLGQLRVALPALQEMGAVAERDSGRAIECAITVVHAAVSRGDPAMTKEMLLNLECTFPDLIAATTAIASLSGLKPGEAEAVSRIPGLESMDSSPPPADTAIQ
jgi:hypothetical protein